MLWEPNDPRPLIIVSQGTLENADLKQLLIPALNALKYLPVRVLATTGGKSVDQIHSLLPENARVLPFISFDYWLPQAAILIVNGGYGSLNTALAYGVPIITANEEDKLEASARVVYAGCGISLNTCHPNEAQITRAVECILNNPSYSQRAKIIQNNFSRYNALESVNNEVLSLVHELNSQG